MESIKKFITEKPMAACAIVAAVALVVGLALCWLSSGKKETFRYLRAPVYNAEKGPRAYAPSEMYMNELPVGAKGAELSATTTWFDHGGKVGGMDNVKTESEMGYTRPDAFSIFQDKTPAPANTLTGVMAPKRGTELSSAPLKEAAVAEPAPATDGQELLPADTVSLLDVDPTISGPGQPVMTVLSDKQPDLSGRAVDFTNPRVPSTLNDSSTPVPASVTEGVEGFRWR